MFQKVKGTQDFLDLTLFNYVIATLSKHLTQYRFTEIATPILEHTELFKRGLGTQTDVVNKEMFTINTGPEGESLCLRPEATACVARAFNEHSIQTTPWKVWLWGPMFRYERPQKGRFRQFHQASLEIIGSQSIAQDAQCIAMLDRYFHDVLGLNNFALLINFIGCSEDRLAYKQLLQEFLNTPAAAVICQTCMVRKETNTLRVFDCKNPECQRVYENAPTIADNLCQPCASEWQQLKDLLGMLSISYAYKPSLVRGLDYYNKTVFEFSSENLGAQNAFCGGGRYDQLVSQLGGRQDQPSIGAAIGIERLMLLLEPLKDQLRLPPLPPLHVIVPIEVAQQATALLVADELYAAGFCCEVLLEGASVKSMMRQANKLGAKFALIIGEDEQATRSVTLKNMITGDSERIAQKDLVKTLAQY